MKLSEVLDKINWGMLYEQKLTLLDVIDFVKENQKEFYQDMYLRYHNDDPEEEYLSKEPEKSIEMLEGLYELLTCLDEAAEEEGLWAFQKTDPGH